jgi:hypothetical protein
MSRQRSVSVTRKHMVVFKVETKVDLEEQEIKVDDKFLIINYV